MYLGAAYLPVIPLYKKKIRFVRTAFIFFRHNKKESIVNRANELSHEVVFQT